MRTLNSHLHQISGMKVLVRCNFDVPISDGRVTDGTRIEETAETLRILLEHGCHLTLLAHQGRPHGKPNPEHSLRPVVGWVETILGETVAFTDDFDLKTVQELPARIILLENLRFWPGEEANNSEFAHQLAQLGRIYVNEAFADCHRSHASIIELPQNMPSYAGVNLEKEIKILSQVRNHPQHPLVVVIGGAKLETKEPLVQAFATKADFILVGGKIASHLKSEKLSENIILASLKSNQKDITKTSADEFAQKILQAKTVIWNGTLGVFEEEENRAGTEIVAEAIAKTPGLTIAGGGDTESALSILHLEHQIDHISSGGGAMLEFLITGTLPGIEVLGYKKQT